MFSFRCSFKLFVEFETLTTKQTEGEEIIIWVIVEYIEN